MTEHNTKSAIEEADIKYFPEISLCADDSPLRLSPLLNDLGYIGDTIAGTYIPHPTTNEHTKLFLQYIKRPANVLEIIVKDTFTAKEYVQR